MEERIDWALTQICDLNVTGYLSNKNFRACIDRMSVVYGTEYIASRMLALGLTTKEDKKMQYNIMCENLNNGTIERLDWTNDYEEALRWMDEYIREDERFSPSERFRYWIEEVEVDD